MSQVALIEDEKNLRSLFVGLLEGAGHQVEAWGSLAEAEHGLSKHWPDLVVLDLKLPDGDGLELLDMLRSRGFRGPALVITAFGTVERAVQALRSGASDFLVKPFDNLRLLSAVEAALERGRRMVEVELAGGSVGPVSEAMKSIVGAQGGLQGVAEVLPKIAATHATVLIRGESGTGKELIARAIHAGSPRLDGPWVTVNCAGLPPSLLESELFGFERGSFTGAHARHTGLIEAADGGTLFLDEIGDMSLEAQSRLLRVLQERELTRIGGREPVKVDVRVIAATHRDLKARVAEGLFREDLFYRLNVVEISLPPLRERRQDIAGLIDHFLEKHAARHARTHARPDDATMRWANQFDWPGNIRELENFVERAVVVGRFEPPREAAPPAKAVAAAAPVNAPVVTLRQAVAEAERVSVLAALRATKGNKTEAARLLGVSYKTLFNKLHEHGIKEEASFG
ncbi:MAG: sigma-54 dependent transcriptional regulator [Myxococcaceae bacterium]